MANLPVGSQVPTTAVMDVTNLAGKDLASREFKEFIIRLTQRLNDIAIVVNNKESSLYSQNEYYISNQYFPDPALNSTTARKPTLRGVFRKVIDFGALPNTATKSVAHGIDLSANTIFTHLYAAATNPGVSYLPIPYASPVLANTIALDVDAVNINITTGSNRTAYTTVYIVLEYIK